MQAPARESALADQLAVFGFVACGTLAVGWPILAGGRLFMDNPSHLAEVRDLAEGNAHGWSDLAFCGFPITAFHSPLWYGLLATVQSLGGPAEHLYAALCLLGFAALPLAVAVVARRRLGPRASLLLVAPLLVRSEAIETTQTPFGGMWPFAIAMALLVLWIAELGRPPDEAGRGLRALRVGLLVALACLTHGVAVVLSPWILGVHLLLAARDPAGRRAIGSDLLGVGVGLAAAASYWMPALLTRDWMVLAFQRNGSPLRVLRGLVDWQYGRAVLLLAAPQVALLLLALLGAAFARRQRDGAAQSATAVAIVLLGLLLFWLPGTDRTTLGPDSSRVVHLVRALLAVAAIPALVALPPRVPARLRDGIALAVVVATLLLGLAWGERLDRRVPRADGRDMAEVSALWDWMRAYGTASWGRVYLQDTFQVRSWPQLELSHPLALTAHETGVRQIGPFYGRFPPPVEAWTRAESQLVLGRDLERPDTDPGEVARLFDAARVSHVVIAETRLRPWFERQAVAYEELWRSERFTVYWRPAAKTEPLAAPPGVAVRDVSRVPGRLSFEVAVPPSAGAISVGSGEAFHPFWRIEGPPGAAAVADRDGLLAVVGVPPGQHRIALRYAPPFAPKAITALGALALAGLGVAAWRRADSFRG